MRSLRYIIGGNPHNLDDCIDMVQKTGVVPNSVVLDLEFFEYPHDELIMIKQMISVYVWKFTDKIIKYEKICGACIFTEKEKRQKRSVDNANIRLENSLSKIDSLGIDVTGKEKRFCYSTIYKGGL